MDGWKKFTNRRDALSQAIPHEPLVEKLRAVVDVQTGNAKRQTRAQPIDSLYDEGAVALKERQTLRPATGDISHCERVDEAAGCDVAAVRDQIHLHEAPNRLVPVGERANRPTLVNRRPRLTSYRRPTLTRVMGCLGGLLGSSLEVSLPA